MRVLVTAFEPFGGDRVNASREAARRLASEWDAHSEGAHLDVLVLPVTFGEAFTPVRAAVDAAVADGVPYDVVLCVGLAARTERVRLERVAINVADTHLPDNAGVAPQDAPLVEDAAAAHFTGLPVREVLSELKRSGIPASVSNSAGTFVCNALFYHVREVFGTRLASGFVHVPRLAEEEVDGDPGLPLATTVRALRTVLATTLAHVGATRPAPALTARAGS